MYVCMYMYVPCGNNQNASSSFLLHHHLPKSSPPWFLLLLCILISCLSYCLHYCYCFLHAYLFLPLLQSSTSSLTLVMGAFAPPSFFIPFWAPLRHVRKNFRRAVKLLLWCLVISKTLYIPCSVRGDGATGQQELQNSLLSSSDSDGHFSPSVISEDLTGQKEQLIGGADQVLSCPSATEGQKDGTYPGHKECNPTCDNKEEGRLRQFKNLPIACSASRMRQHGSVYLLPDGAVNRPSLFFGSLPAATNVAIIHPILEWGPQPLFSPSLGSLTIVNTRNDSVLFTFPPYSTDSYFNITGVQEATLPAGGMMSIRIIYLPKKVGLTEGLLVVHTTAGVFFIQMRGEGVESSYQLQTLPNVTTTQTNLRHNAFDEPLFVEEVGLWIADKQEMALHAADPFQDGGTGVSWKNNTTSGRFQMSAGSPDCIQLTDGESVEGGGVRLRRVGEWEVESHNSKVIVDLEVSLNTEKAVQGATCAKVVHAMEDLEYSSIQTLKLQPQKEMESHWKAHVKPNDLNFGILNHKKQESKLDVVLVNPGPHSVLVEDIYSTCLDVNIIDIEYVGNLVFQPRTERLAATVTYAASEQRLASAICPSHDSDSDKEFKLIIKTNSTMDPFVKIQYRAVVLLGPQNCSSQDSSGKTSENDITFASTLTETLCKANINLPILSGPLQLYRNSGNSLWALQLDETLLQDGPVVSSKLASGKSVLQDSKLAFTVTPLGTKEMQWVHVGNPSDKPIAVQLWVSSEAGAINGVDTGVLMDGDPGDSMGNGTQSHASLDVKHLDDSHTQDGIFSIAEGGVAKVVLQPNGTDALGPIVFCPIEQCNSTGFLILQNNLTGIEWMPMHESGGSAHLIFSSGDDMVQVLELDFNFTFLYSAKTTGTKRSIADLFYDRSAKSICCKCMVREFMAKNTGDFPLQVESLVLIGSSGFSQRFRIDSSHSFHLAPEQLTKLLISYPPDLTTGFTEGILQVTTSHGIHTVPLRVNIPALLPPFCYKASLAKRLFQVCVMALFLVLLVLIKMLKQEREAAVDPSQWPLAMSSARLCRHGGTYHNDHDMQNFLDRPVFSMQDSCDLDRFFDDTRIFIKAFSFVGVIGALIGNLAFSIKSLFVSETQEGLPSLKVRISAVENTVAPLTKPNSDQCNQNIQNSAEVSNVWSGKKGYDPHSCNQALKVGDRPCSVMGTAETVQALGSGTGSQEMLPSTSYPQLDKLQPQSRKVGLLEKDRGKRKKRRNNMAVIRREVDSEGRSGSSSPLSSPSSPATSSSSSRPVSPFFRQKSASIMEHVAADQEHHTEVPAIVTPEILSQIDVDVANGSDALHTEMREAGCLMMSFTKVDWTVSQDPAGVDGIRGLPSENAKRAEDLGATEQRGSEHEEGLDQSWIAVGMKRSGRNKTLTASATFPQRGRRSDMDVPTRYHRNHAWMSNGSLVSTSAISPHARAPGTRFSKQCADKPPEKRGAARHDVLHDATGRNSELSCGVSRNSADLQSNAPKVAVDFVYDIWGDHFAEISRTTQSSWSFKDSILQSNSIKGNLSLLQGSHSLFSRSGFDMQGGMVDKVDIPSPVSCSSDFSVFSAADPFLSCHIEQGQ